MCNIPKQKTIAYSRVIHLSHVIDPDIPRWPGDPPVEFETVAELAPDGYYLRRFSMGEHTATHMNAPNSFHLGGVGIETYEAESLVVPAVVIDIRDFAEANSDYQLSIPDVLAWEEKYGMIPPGSVVLLYTGWQYKWPEDLSVGDENDIDRDRVGDIFLNQQHFPGFAGPTTRFLLDQRQIAGVGIDTHGVDSGQDETFATNRQVLELRRIVLENLTNLEQLPPTGTILVIGILRLRDGSGCPAAIMAFVP